MPQYLVAVYHRDDYDPSVETEATVGGDPRGQSRDDRWWCQEVRLRPGKGAWVLRAFTAH